VRSCFREPSGTPENSLRQPLNESASLDQYTDAGHSGDFNVTALACMLFASLSGHNVMVFTSQHSNPFETLPHIQLLILIPTLNKLYQLACSFS
jgi:hypothetical protein